MKIKSWVIDTWNQATSELKRDANGHPYLSLSAKIRVALEEGGGQTVWGALTKKAIRPLKNFRDSVASVLKL